MEFLIHALPVIIVLLVVGIIYKGGILSKTLLIVISVLCLALTAELLYLYILLGDTKQNYFLFDPNTNRNIPAQKLTFQLVNSRMNKYLSGFASSEGKIWTEGVFDNPSLELDEAFKPLIGDKLLFDLAERDFDAGWKCFDMASDTTVDFIASAIEMNDEGEVAKNIRDLKATKPTNLKYVRDYLVSNRKYLQTKMYQYVAENIDKF